MTTSGPKASRTRRRYCGFLRLLSLLGTVNFSSSFSAAFSGSLATAESITATLAPLIGGQVADLFGYNVVFGLSIGVLAAGLLLLITAVKEPRTAKLSAN